MHGQKILFSKKSDNWATPEKLYNLLNSEFHFDFDPCPLNSKFDGLTIKWGKTCFVNPPYSNITNFIKKGLEELKKGHSKKLVYLLPARTDTAWFHDYVLGKSAIRFIRGRLKFGNSKNSAPFPSLIAIFVGKSK
jgi:site-specific DNA-methyltransferase (adenine-specific)